MTNLLIDDSADIRAVFRVTLESEGFRLLEAADGREGVRLYREHQPALAIVDIVMPKKDGLETVREILAIDPAAVIITMSGQDDAEDHNEVARMLGARWRQWEGRRSLPDDAHGMVSSVRAAEIPGQFPGS